MRILVVSDTHRRCSPLSEVLFREPDAKLVIHLGDGEGDVARVREEFPDRIFECVAGNCDFMPINLPVRTLMFEGRLIYCTHGHLHNVKSGTAAVIAAARSNNADTCLFGHTHEPLYRCVSGLHVMNPGSLGNPRNAAPTYGIIDITKDEIVCDIRKL